MWRSKQSIPAASHPGWPLLRVLVVDDNPVNLMLASELFSLWRITPLLAVDGTEAVAMACELHLDLILMDLQMPVLDGIAATKQIRRFEREHSVARVPVVAYTSCAPDRRSLSAFGIDDLLDKPCDIRALQECVQRWCPSVPLSTPWVHAEASRHH